MEYSLEPYAVTPEKIRKARELLKQPDLTYFETEQQSGLAGTIVHCLRRFCFGASDEEALRRCQEISACESFAQVNNWARAHGWREAPRSDQLSSLTLVK